MVDANGKSFWHFVISSGEFMHTCARVDKVFDKQLRVKSKLRVDSFGINVAEVL